MRKCKQMLLCGLLMGLLMPLPLHAQSTYIYIELIKAIPCKVIQNGQEVAQLNKNYVLLPIAEQREQNIDIEFGAELYPRQSFVIDAMPDAAFAYKLARSGEKSFYLLDLVNNGKIIESNSKVNIGIGTELNKINFGKDQPPHQRKKVSSNRGWMRRLVHFVAYSRKDGSGDKKEQAPVVKSEKPKPQYGIVQVIEPEKVKANTNQQNVTSGKKEVKTGKSPMRASCRLLASDKEVEMFADKLGQKSNEEVQLLMARKKQFTGCLSVQHILQLGEQYHSQYGRLQFVKIIMNIAANPMELPQCESLFKTDAYKNKFLELIQAN